MEMASRDFDEVVTKTDRRAKERMQGKHDAHMRKQIQREKPAYVRRAVAKADAKHRVPVERMQEALRQRRNPNIKLATNITRYVDRNGGEVQGMDLEEIYTEFAQVLLRDDSRDSLKLIGSAVQYAIGKRWLEEKEAEGYVFTVPVLYPAA